MSEGQEVSLRIPLALGLACALAVPLGMGVPAGSAATPTRQVLLAATGELDDVSAAVTAAGGTVVQTYEVAEALLAKLPETAAVPQGAFVVPNVTMKFNAAPAATAVSSDALNSFKDTINAPAAGGDGVTVAVVDTGVDSAADITVSDRANVSGGPAGDGYGHGTFMAGLVAGDDARFGGVAPNASVFDVQVAAADGSTDLSRVLAGLQAVADKRANDPSLDVAMLALSAQSPLPSYLDPLATALDKLWERGVTVVVASGNGGKDSLSSPATDPKLLVVGSQDEKDTAARGDDVVADFSAYGSVLGTPRPDVVAPGVSLISTSPVNSSAYVQNPGSQVTTGYLKGSGTSMSSAVAAGAAAVLLAARPDLAPNDVKNLFRGTAYQTADLTAAKGAGQGGLDLGAALTTAVADVPVVEQAPGNTQHGPSELDAATWAQFAQAWADGDLGAVAKAWAHLSPQTRKWAANAWSMAALMRALQQDDNTFDGRRWAGRRWATQNWEGRRWAEDAWVGRRWADEAWLASVWDGRRWAGRRWASSDWLAFAWTLRDYAVAQEVQDLQGEETGWEGRRWADVAWVGRRWADTAWEGRRWADASWDGRRWADASWDGRRWADFAFEGRRWAQDTWDGRRWAVAGW